MEPINEPLVQFAKSLKDEGVLDAPARLKALEERVSALADAVEASLAAANVEHSKSLKKLTKQIAALAGVRVSKIHAVKTLDGGWDLTVENAQ